MLDITDQKISDWLEELSKVAFRCDFRHCKRCKCSVSSQGDVEAVEVCSVRSGLPYQIIRKSFGETYLFFQDGLCLVKGVFFHDSDEHPLLHLQWEIFSRPSRLDGPALITVSGGEVSQISFYVNGWEMPFWEYFEKSRPEDQRTLLRDWIHHV
jgi:hypothetical protein